MIFARFGKNAQVVTSVLPKIGERIYVEGMGSALVEGFSHIPVRLQNFITLEFQETLKGKFQQTCPFELEM